MDKFSHGGAERGALSAVRNSPFLCAPQLFLADTGNFEAIKSRPAA